MADTPRKRAAKKTTRRAPLKAVPTPPADGPAAGKKTAPPKSRRPRKGTSRIPAPQPDELAELRERQRRAVELAIAGASYDAIAQELGYADRSGAWRAVHEALNRWEAPKVAELRQMENARLDRLQAAWWTKAVTDKDPNAARIILKVFERRARLNGLDQQISADADALSKLLGDPDARTARLIALHGQVSDAMRAKASGHDV
jgi:hypothetical protein